MSEFAEELGRLMAARGMGVRELARRMPCNPGHISQLRSGQKRPSPQTAKRLDDVLEAGGRLAGVAAMHGVRPRPAEIDATSVADDAVELAELTRRIERSDVGSATLEALEMATDRLCREYPTVPV